MRPRSGNDKTGLNTEITVNRVGSKSPAYAAAGARICNASLFELGGDGTF